MACKLSVSDLQIITRVAVVRSLNIGTVEHIVAPAAAVKLRVRDCLFDQGDLPNVFFITISGWVKLYRITRGRTGAIRSMTHAPILAATGGR